MQSDPLQPYEFRTIPDAKPFLMVISKMNHCHRELEFEKIVQDTDIGREAQVSFAGKVGGTVTLRYSCGALAPAEYFQLETAASLAMCISAQLKTGEHFDLDVRSRSGMLTGREGWERFEDILASCGIAFRFAIKDTHEGSTRVSFKAPQHVRGGR